MRVAPEPELCDSALEIRDADEKFEEQWLNLSAQVSEHAFQSDEREVAKQLAKKAFLSVSKVTNQHEIASYVADDIELLALACLAEIQSEFAEQLYQGYRRDGFGKPPLPRTAV